MKYLLLLLLVFNTAVAEETDPVTTLPTTLTVKGSVTEKINIPELEKKSLWQMTLHTDPKKLLSWYVKNECEIDAISGEKIPHLVVHYYQAEEKIEKPITIIPDKPTHFIIELESSKPSVAFSLDWFNLAPEVELNYHCKILEVKWMSDPLNDDTDKALLEISS